jgi:hydroxylamine dehydrogenase
MYRLILLITLVPLAALGQQCVGCHKQVTPGVVADWQLSRHAQISVDCSACHGGDHNSAEDVSKVLIPTVDICKTCHPTQVAQFTSGKHAFAWAAMSAMPTFHRQAMAMTEGMKGCGGCHKIGLKSKDKIKELKAQGRGFGLASCDACHTRHTFSKLEAQQPQACQTCHMGFDHPQWEMYSASKHGIRYLLKQDGTLPETGSAPTCQTCHMQEGNHGVRTAWGFLAVRLPMPEDEQWTADRVTILKGLGVLDPEGNPTGRLDVVKQAGVARLTQKEFNAERNKMIETCSGCHSENFARAELAKGDEMIRNADRLMAQAIQIVAGLYADGIIQKPKSYAFNYPDLLTFHDAATPVEIELHEMHLEHRMRTFQGTFHANPDYALWYGWAAMTKSLTKIRHLAGQMRAHASE